MKQFFTVLKFELGNYFKNKGFVLTTLLLAVFFAGAVILPGFFIGGESTKADPDSDDNTPVALLDEQGILGDRQEFEQLLPDFNWINCADEEELNKSVRDGQAEAGFIIESATGYRYVVENNPLTTGLADSFEEAFAKQYRMKALAEAGIDADQVEALYETPMQSEMVILGKDSARNYIYTYVLVLVMYIIIIFYGQMIATSVTTEKSNRAIEILVTSVNSNSLIFGKILAGALSSLIQGGIILGAGVGAYHFSRDSWNHQLDFLFDIPGEVWATFIVFGILGYFLYAFVFGMLGALVSKTEDISKSAMPVTMIYIVAFFAAIVGMNSPDSLLMKVLSFVPFTSCNSMFVRVAMGSVSAAEIVISALLLLASCGAAGVLTAKIFRLGTLMYGNPVKLRSALKKIRERQ